MRIIFLILSGLFLSSCAIVSMDRNYEGPVARGPDIDAYYGHDFSNIEYDIRLAQTDEDFDLYRIRLKVEVGEVDLSYFKAEKKSDTLILVFPLLGGKNRLSGYFADYFARAGLDAVVVHRNNDFKDPSNFERIEELIRRELILNRVVLDFFEREYGKKEFGSFGISRGAISAATTAGIEERLKYNVFALGAADIANIYKHSDERKIRRYVEKVSKSRELSHDEIFTFINETVKTDPKFFSKHIDARNTLLILGLFDSTVPIEYGLKLRELIGKPKTVFLFAGHRTSGAFTQFFKLFPPVEKGTSLFPLDYVEGEATQFFREKFRKGYRNPVLALMRIIQIPFNFVAEIVSSIGE